MGPPVRLTTSRAETQQAKLRVGVAKDRRGQGRTEKDTHTHTHTLTHLTLALCRTLLVRALKGLEDVISVTALGWFVDFETQPYRGWPFTAEQPDPLHPEFTHLHDVYRLADKDYPHRSISVPVLFDKKTQTIVNNESAEIIGMRKCTHTCVYVCVCARVCV